MSGVNLTADHQLHITMEGAENIGVGVHQRTRNTQLKFSRKLGAGCKLMTSKKYINAYIARQQWARIKTPHLALKIGIRAPGLTQIR